MNLVPKYLNIIKHPNRILRQDSFNISRPKSEKTRQLVTDMIYTMKSAHGIGLAAPQVGRNLNLFVTDDGSGPKVYINPLILKKSRKKNVVEEGCLSIPDVFGNVTRPECVWVYYRDINGKRKLRRRTGMLARIFQHEYDHLRGVLFIDKVDRITHGADTLKEYEDSVQ